MANSESVGPVITGASWLVTLVALVFLGLRLCMKTRQRGSLWWDDYLLALSWICLLIQVSLVQKAISLGFGMHIVDIAAAEPLNVTQIAIYVQVVLTIAGLAINFSKISFAVTLLRLTKGWWQYFVWFIIGSLVVLMIPALIFPWVQCVPFVKSFDDTIPGTCFPKSIAINYAIFEAGWSAAVDFALAMIPWTILWKLQMLRSEKIGVGLAMSLGVFAGIVSIVKGVFVVQLDQHDFSFYGKDVTIWAATEPAAAIIAASIPVLRVFVRDKSSRRKYGSSKYGNGTSNDVHLGKLSTKVKSAGGFDSHQRAHSKTWITSEGDDESVKSILGDELNTSGIVQTSTISIEYLDEADGHRLGPNS